MSENSTTPPSSTPENTDGAKGRRCQGGCRGAHGHRRGRARRFFFFGGLLALFAGLAAIPALAHGGGRCHMSGADGVGFFADHLLDRVDATDDQRAKVDALVEEAGPKIDALREESQGLRRELVTTLLSDDPDPAAIEAIRLRGLTLADQGSKELLGLLTEGVSLLDGDQKAKLADLAQRHLDRER